MKKFGKDKNVLRRVVATCLDYGLTNGMDEDVSPMRAMLPKNSEGRSVPFGTETQHASAI